MLRRNRLGRGLLLSVDVTILVVSIWSAYWIRFNAGVFEVRPVQPHSLYINFSLLVGLIGAVLLLMSGRNQPNKVFSFPAIFRLSQAATFTFLIAVVCSFLLRGYLSDSDIETQSRLVLLTAWVLAVAALGVWRFALSRLLIQLRHRGRGLSRILILGVDEPGLRFYEATKSDPTLGYNPVGFLGRSESAGSPVDQRLVLGEIDDFEGVIKRLWVDEVIVTGSCLQPERIARLLTLCERADIQFNMLPGFLEIITTQSRIREVGGIPLVTVEEQILDRWNQSLKRLMDIVLTTGLVVLFTPVLVPLFLLVALAIKLESPGSVLFRQQRVGKGGRPFDMYKFRSMRQDAEALRGGLLHLNEAEGPLFKIRKDPRITRVGSLLRRYSIDELPQIINVIMGHMSLVGPRPPFLAEVEQYTDWQHKRFEVYPGMVGLPQVSGRSDLSFDEVIRLDLYYIENWSILLDIEILIKAVPVVLMGRGAY